VPVAAIIMGGDERRHTALYPARAACNHGVDCTRLMRRISAIARPRARPAGRGKTIIGDRRADALFHRNGSAALISF
jgi:hypothetical protein